jgi:hypothetical protein
MQIHADLVDATATRLIAAGVCGGNVVKDQDQPTSDAELPVAIVHVMFDKGKAAGNARHGYPYFEHEINLVVDVYAKAASGTAVKAALYAAGEAVLQALLTDPAWLALGDGIQSLEQSYLAPAEGAYTTSGLRIEFGMLHRTTWLPSTAAVPDLTTVSIGVDTGDDAPVLGATILMPT